MLQHAHVDTYWKGNTRILTTAMDLPFFLPNQYELQNLKAMGKLLAQTDNQYHVPKGDLSFGIPYHLHRPCDDGLTTMCPQSHHRHLHLLSLDYTQDLGSASSSNRFYLNISFETDRLSAHNITTPINSVSVVIANYESKLHKQKHCKEEKTDTNHTPTGQASVVR